MPVDMKRYPPEWKAISLRICKRARGRCECTGECGKPNGHAKGSGRCTARNGKPHPVTGSKQILTVAHLGTPKPDGSPGDKHDKMDCRDENLKAMCNSCHLNFDRDEHIFNGRRTRRRKFLAAGNRELPLMEIRE